MHAHDSSSDIRSSRLISDFRTDYVALKLSTATVGGRPSNPQPAWPQGDGAQFQQLARTVRPYPLFVDHYRVPYLVDRPGEGERIAGELFRPGRPGAVKRPQRFPM